MNAVILTGRFTRDPEIRVSQGANATTVARFSLAVNRDRKVEGQADADFVNCVAFGKTAEFIEKYFTKGMKIEVRGRWQTGSYKKDDGTTVYTNDCFCEQVGFAESKISSNDRPESKTDADGFANIGDAIDEELPFI